MINKIKFNLFIIFLLYFAVNSTNGFLKCEKDFFKTKIEYGNMDYSVLLIWYPTEVGVLSKLRVCSNETGLPLKRHCAYNRTTNTAKWEEINTNIKLINCSSIDNECRSEFFQHEYMMKNGNTILVNNTWKSAKIGEYADLEKPCLNSNGLSLTRRCLFNAFQRQAMWELLAPNMRNVTCLREIRQDIITYNLNALYMDVKTAEEQDAGIQSTNVVEKMTELLTTTHTVRLPADIKISCDILKIVTEDNTHNNNPELVEQILNVTDIITYTDPSVVLKSQEVNAPTEFLHTIDKYFKKMVSVLVTTDHCANTTDGIFHKTVNNTSVFYINPMCSNISGVAIYETNHQNQEQHCFSRHLNFDAYTRNCYRFLYMNESFEQIINIPDLRIATYIPLSLWQKINNVSNDIDNQRRLMVVIFPNDVLFVNRTVMNYKPARNVLEIVIANYTGTLPEDIPFILSYGNSGLTLESQPYCGYWNYKNWTTRGITTEQRNISSNFLLICHSSHLTHLAAIFQTKSFPPLPVGDRILISISDDQMLDYISIAGCGLSMMGLVCIWLTAICFPNWSRQPSIKVLLNMSFVLTLIMVYFLLLNFPHIQDKYMNMKNKIQCIIMGGFLHYSILVLFLWMLIIAIMQYQRYVKVVGYERSSNFVLKYGLIAWGLPLIPAIFVAIYDPNTYTPTSERFDGNTAVCYPSGKCLLYAVIVPMAIIMLMNLAIFIYIFYSVHCSLRQFSKNNEKKRILSQVRVAVLLFFLLGISWIFGLLTFIYNNPTFAYIFCFTSTLQGFVLFIFSIVIEKSTRDLWMILCCAKSYYTREGESTTSDTTKTRSK